MSLLISTPQNTHFSVAIGNETIEQFKVVKKSYRQSELLLKTINEFVGTGHCPARAAVKNIFVVEGPGAFSALRIGIATANALSYGWKIPVIGIKLKKEWQALEEKEKLEKIWQAGVAAIKNKTKNKGFVAPFYGSEPNITMKIKSQKSKVRS